MTDQDLERLQSTWQTEPTDIKDIDMDTILRNAASFQKRIRTRNALEWTAALVLLPFFATMAWKAPTLWSQLMYAELVAALIFIAAVLFFRGRMERQTDPLLSTDEFLHFSRQQIERQIRLLSKARYWYVAPLFFGLLGLELERALAIGSAGKIPWLSIAFVFLLSLMAVWIVWLNEVQGIKKLQERLEALS